MSIKGQGHSFTLVKDQTDFKVKTFFSQKQLVIWNQSSYECLWEHGIENLYKLVGSRDQVDCHAHIWKTTLKIFFSRTNGLMTLKVGM